MAIRIRLGDYERQTDDALGRDAIGYFPRMTETEAWEAGRGLWRLNLKVVSRERFAVIVGQDLVRAVAGITDVTAHMTGLGPKKALEGDLLGPGHPMYDRYINQPDPLANDSRNSIAYGDLPEEAQFRTRDCACGCDQSTTHDFVPGHELRAIQARVREHFGGSVLSFITWLDAELQSTNTGA
ncbi:MULTISPECIES: hypothetical protein [Nocardiopsis]|uniref:Uncharacterized protein n=1 Tax=Nocardiopsis metallicus TaxID=179819 RepID=A0A840WMG6_9ACTN|nr:MULTISPECIES: hypothetical protein [Nocardiopsis]MBB5491308.1 hypothetical protein [Nocardiopsis metallicus]